MHARTERESRLFGRLSCRLWRRRLSPRSLPSPVKIWSASGWERARSLSASCLRWPGSKRPPSFSLMRCAEGRERGRLEKERRGEERKGEERDGSSHITGVILERRERERVT
eukprot:1160300-Pelagomonas_calceolata.AAC.12